MSVTLALVPIVSLCALFLLVLLFLGLRSARIAEMKREDTRFKQTVLEQDAAIQQTLLSDLLEGRSPAESLAEFERKRADLLPGACLEEPAGWDTKELAECAKRQFEERLSEVNRKLGIGTVTIGVVIIGICVVLSAVLYNFQSGSANQSATLGTNVPGLADPLAPPLSTIAPPQSGDASAPTPDAGQPANGDTNVTPADAGKTNASNPTT